MCDLFGGVLWFVDVGEYECFVGYFGDFCCVVEFEGEELFGVFFCYGDCMWFIVDIVVVGEYVDVLFVVEFVGDWCG